jgi:hypothetical protein
MDVEPPLRSQVLGLADPSVLIEIRMELSVAYGSASSEIVPSAVFPCGDNGTGR